MVLRCSPLFRRQVRLASALALVPFFGCGTSSRLDVRARENEPVARATKLDEATARIAGLEKDLAALRIEQSNLKQAVDTAATGGCLRLRAKPGAELSLAQRVCNLSSEASGDVSAEFESRVAALARSLGDRVDGLDSGRAQLVLELASLREDAERASGAAADARSESEAVATLVADLTARTLALEAQTIETRATLAGVEARLGAVESTVISLREATTDLAATQDSLRLTFAALENAVATLAASLADTLEPIDLVIGPGTGTVRALLRTRDGSRLYATLEPETTTLSIPASNPLQVAVGSSEASLIQGAAALRPGDEVFFAGCSGGFGLSAQDINGTLSVTYVGQADELGRVPFRVRMRRARTQSGTPQGIGGTACSAFRTTPQGLVRIWTRAEGADSVERSLGRGNSRVTFAVVEGAAGAFQVCYDPASPGATLDELLVSASRRCE
jgi:hypothetical protein